MKRTERNSVVALFLLLFLLLYFHHLLLSPLLLQLLPLPLLLPPPLPALSTVLAAPKPILVESVPSAISLILIVSIARNVLFLIVKLTYFLVYVVNTR